MGAIKDLVDLVTQFSNSVEDRKFAAELRQIQSMIGGIQSEHAAMHEQRIGLMTENADLKEVNISLKQQIASLQQEIINLKNQKFTPVNKLSEEAEKVLIFFTKYTDITADQIAHSISLDLTRTEHWLDILQDSEMIDASYSMMDPTTYTIASKGRKYLVENNII